MRGNISPSHCWTCLSYIRVELLNCFTNQFFRSSSTASWMLRNQWKVPRCNSLKSSPNSWSTLLNDLVLMSRRQTYWRLQIIVTLFTKTWLISILSSLREIKTKKCSVWQLNRLQRQSSSLKIQRTTKSVLKHPSTSSSNSKAVSYHLKSRCTPIGEPTKVSTNQ